MKVGIKMKVLDIKERFNIDFPEDNEPRCFLAYDKHGRILEVSTRDEALTETCRILGIAAPLTEEGFLAAGGMFLIFEGEVLFPEGRYLDRTK